MAQVNGDTRLSECSSLLTYTAVRPDTKIDSFVCNRCSLFYFFWFLSGQYINFDSKKKVVSVAGLVMFAILIIVYIGQAITAVGVEVYKINENWGNNCHTVCKPECPAAVAQ